MNGKARKAPYRPSEKEPYMNERQRAYFRRKLLTWQADLVKAIEATRNRLRQESRSFAEELDRAKEELGRAIEIRTRERYRKLLAKIDAALVRIENGTYGYCEQTSEPIGLRRLEARPIATYFFQRRQHHVEFNVDSSSARHRHRYGRNLYRLGAGRLKDASGPQDRQMPHHSERP